VTEFGFALSEQHLTTPIHLALLHYGLPAMREAMVDFLSPALDDPTQAIYFCGPPGGAARLLSYLEQDTGRDLHEEVNNKRIVLGQGDPDADQQLQNLLDPVHELCERGFSLVRVVGPAAWEVEGYSAPEDFLWYESRILPGIEGLPVAIMCTYDAAELPAPALLYGALETHTHTLIHGVLSENPSFLPAERYLRTRLINLPWLNPSDQGRET
jgi:hypothetical protein